MTRLGASLCCIALLAGACSAGDPIPPAPTPGAAGGTTTTIGEPAEPDLQLVVLWHQHQPAYPRDEEDGVVTRPWVRLRATKDYVTMVTTLTEHPDVRATVNLTPVLLTQLRDFLDGTRDAYWVHAEIPAEQLDDDERRFVMRRFFDVDERTVQRFPRYVELAELRNEAGGPDAPVDALTTDDYRDLQVLFNLAWTGPEFLAEEPLAGLVERGGDFTEADKALVLAEHERIVDMFFDVHAEAWDSGQLEVSTSPLAHPILPLLLDTDVALAGDPGAVLPSQRFSEPGDAIAQVEGGLALAEELLGRRPVGMWPAGGAVSQPSAAVMAEGGIEWIASGGPVLAAGAGLAESFSLGAADVPDGAELLYRPHAVDLGDGVGLPILFGDVGLSELVTEYSGGDGEAAADAFIDRLEAIADELGPAPEGRPWVVSVVLDVDDAANGGTEFLSALYGRLGSTEWLGTTTPSAYLAEYGTPELLDHELFPGSRLQASYAPWIGDAEEATAWDYLARTRAVLDEVDASDEQLAEATEAMFLAEGSDWFWWFGADQSSGDDAYFDRAFRTWLRRVYEALDAEVPAFVGIPVVPAVPVPPDVEPSGDAVSPTIDGTVTEEEWIGAAVYDLDGSTFLAGVDAERLSLALPDPGGPVRLALGVPFAEPYSGVSGDGEEVGFGITHELVVATHADGARRACLISAFGDSCSPIDDDVEPLAGPDRFAVGVGEIEVSIPTSALGALEPGDRIAMRWLEPDLLPATAPAELVVPDIAAVDVAVDVADPVGDDHGPGTYTYPTDAAFLPGSFDLTRFSVGTQAGDILFTFEVDAPICNPWGSAVGLSIQTFDVYIDVDPGAGTGATALLDGRNAALEPGDGWEVGLTLEGWESALYVAEGDETQETFPTIEIATSPERGKVIVRVPADLLPGGDPADWGYAVAVLGQDGLRTPGVRRVRDVGGVAGQWRFGGAPAGAANHTRIIDLLVPDEGGAQGEQARLLTDPATIPLVTP